jgi:hypothetical protein
VRGIAVVLVALGMLALAASSVAAPSAATPTLRAALKGSCTVTTRLDANGVVTGSTLTCEAKGACACAGPTRLVYESSTTSPGNGAPGRERGTLSAAGALGSVTLALTGTRTGVGQSEGTWTLAKASGFAGVRLLKRGVYSSRTTDLEAILGTRSTTVSIAASISCWDCQAGG